MSDHPRGMLEAARDMLQRAVACLPAEPTPSIEPLQQAWTDHVQHLWERKYLPDELNSRFKEMWRRYTVRNEDPRTTELRTLTSEERESAISELRLLCRDAEAWDACRGSD